MLIYTLCFVAALTGGIVHFTVEHAFLWPGASLIWGGGLILLVYGMLRDIYLLRACPCQEGESKQKSSMICVESLVGFSAVALGLGLQWLEWSQPVTISLGVVVAVTAVIVALGHKTRDWVLILAEVPGHHNVIPTFRMHTAQETAALLDSRT